MPCSGRHTQINFSYIVNWGNLLYLFYKSLNDLGPGHIKEIIMEYKANRLLRSSVLNKLVEIRIQSKHGKTVLRCYAARR